MAKIDGETAVKAGKTVMDIGKGISKVFGTSKPKDNVLFRNRDAIFDLFRAIGLSSDNGPLNDAVKKNRMGHDDIPSNKPVGQSYQEEWDRLYDMVVDTFLNIGREDLAKLFTTNQPRWTTTVHPQDYLITLIKGSSAPAVKQAQVAKYSMLEPLAPIMVVALQSKGVAVPNNLEDIAQLFYNNFVAVKSTYSDNNYEPIDFMHISPEYHLDEAIVEAIVAYIKNIQDQKNSGIQLPAVLDKLANGANVVQTKLTEQAKKGVANEIGKTILENTPMLIIGAVILIIGIVFFMARKR